MCDNVFLHTEASRDDLKDINVETKTVSPDKRSNCYQEQSKFNSSGLSSRVDTTCRLVVFRLEGGCEVEGSWRSSGGR